MNKIQRVNASTFFRDFVRDNRATAPVVRQVEEDLAGLINGAPTFILPDGGTYSHEKNFPVELAPKIRLPFPTTVFEFNLMGKRGAIKQMLVAQETIDNGVVTITVLRAVGFGDPNSWEVNPVRAIWSGGITTVNSIDIEDAQRRMTAVSELTDMIRTFTPEVGSKILKIRGDVLHTHGYDETMLDLAYARALSGMIHVCSACAILSCPNVKVIDVPLTSGDRWVNEKRVKKGLTPLVEYKVLQLGEKKIYANDRGGTHESPKWHMVMGFVRRLVDDKYYMADTPMEERLRTTFVPAHARGNADKGKIVKDYQLVVPT